LVSPLPASLAACTALNLTADDFAAINKQINDAIDGSTHPLASIHGDWSEPAMTLRCRV